MRKGFSLVELLVVLAVISIVSVPLAGLSTTTLRDIPRAYKMIESNTSILNALKQIRKDVNVAKGFPKSFNGFTTNGDTLLIERANGTICYQLKDGEIVRQTLTDTKVGRNEKIINWAVPQGKVKWRVWQKNGKGYAVEVKTYIEQKSGEHLEKKMANSHLYFVGVYQEAVN